MGETAYSGLLLRQEAVLAVTIRLLVLLAALAVAAVLVLQAALAHLGKVLLEDQQ
jgi:hypothetical protein